MSDITTNLIVHLPFDDGFDDISDSGLTGSPTSLAYPTDFITGQIGLAVDRTSASDSLSYGTVTIPEGSVSFTGWFNMSVGPADDLYIFAHSNATDYGGFQAVIVNSGTLRCRLGANGTWQTGPSVSSLYDDEWHFVAIVFDYAESEITYYVDDAAGSTVALSAYTGWATDRTLGVGSRIGQGSGSLAGLDELRIYTERALTSDEVTAVRQYVPASGISSMRPPGRAVGHSPGRSVTNIV